MITGISFEYCVNDEYAEYTLYDTDFIDHQRVDLIKSSNPYVFECIELIIITYEKRNLNVAYNIALWLMNTYTTKIEEYIEECKKILPEYSKYANDVEKYLILI